MPNKDPLAQYRQLSIESKVQEASPHGLIELLFCGAITRLKQAHLAMESADYAEGRRLLGRIQEILATLRSSLDFSAEADISPSQPPLPRNLDALYDYCQRRLLRANINKDPLGLLEVQYLLESVHEAWQAISPLSKP